MLVTGWLELHDAWNSYEDPASVYPTVPMGARTCVAGITTESN